VTWEPQPQLEQESSELYRFWKVVEHRVVITINYDSTLIRRRSTVVARRITVEWESNSVLSKSNRSWDQPTIHTYNTRTASLSAL